MLGEKLLFGQTTSIIDKQRRLNLSAKTEREEGEVVYLVYDNYIDEYKIVPYAIIKDEFENYQNLIKSANSAKDLKKYKLLLNTFADSIKKECKVDPQGRIILSDDFDKNELITVIGAGNHLVLRRTKPKQ